MSEPELRAQWAGPHALEAARDRRVLAGPALIDLGTWMRRFAITVIMPLTIVACNTRRTSPLAAIGEVTRAQVTVLSGGASTSTIVTDSAVLARLRSLATAQGDWKPTWHTAPAGQVRAALFRDTTFVGVVSIGPDFIGARGASDEQFRPISASEEPIVAALRVLE